MTNSTLSDKMSVTLWAVIDTMKAVHKLTTSEAEAWGFASARNSTSVNGGMPYAVEKMDGVFMRTPTGSPNRTRF